MKIDSYEFGKIVIDGKEYTKDLILCEDIAIENWIRAVGHKLYLSDIYMILESELDILVIGTGKYDMMKIEESEFEEIKKNIPSVIVMSTDRAFVVYNSLVEDGKKVAGAFHLTC